MKLLTSLLPVLLLPLALAGSSLNGGHDVALTLSKLPELDIGVPLPEAVNDIIETFKNVDAMPLCEKVASAGLIHSCSGMEAGNDQDISYVFESGKSIYATRLAICEIKEAGSPPSACSAFVPTRKNTRKQGISGFFRSQGPTEPITRYQDYDNATEEELKTCLVALATEGWWWTSYSNARQRGAIVCHSMKVSVEKDDIINLYAAINEVNSKASETLLNNVEDAREFRKQFETLVASMESSHKALADQFEDMRDSAIQFWVDFHSNLNYVSEEIDNILMNSFQANMNLEFFNEEISALTADMITGVSTASQLVAQSHQDSLSMVFDLNALVSDNYLALSASLSALQLELDNTHRVVAELANATLSVPTLDSALESLGRSWMVQSGELYSTFKAFCLFFVSSAILCYIFGIRNASASIALSIVAATALTSVWNKGKSIDLTDMVQLNSNPEPSIFVKIVSSIVMVALAIILIGYILCVKRPRVSNKARRAALAACATDVPRTRGPWRIAFNDPKYWAQKQHLKELAKAQAQPGYGTING